MFVCMCMHVCVCACMCVCSFVFCIVIYLVIFLNITVFSHFLSGFHWFQTVSFFFVFIFICF